MEDNDDIDKFIEELEVEDKEYAALTIMVRVSSLPKLLATLKKSGLEMAVMPDVSEKVDFYTDDEEDDKETMQ